MDKPDVAALEAKAEIARLTDLAQQRKWQLEECESDLAKAEAEIARLREALTDTTEALAKFVNTKAKTREPYETALSAYDRGIAALKQPEPVAWRRIEEIDRETDGYVYYGRSVEGAEPLYKLEVAQRMSAAGSHGYFKPLKPYTGENFNPQDNRWYDPDTGE